MCSKEDPFWKNQTLRELPVDYLSSSQIMSSKQPKELAPLQDLLDSVLSRLAALESHAGIVPPAPSAAKHSVVETSPSPSAVHDGHPAVVAYDSFIESAVVPFCNSCCELEGMQNTGDLFRNAWVGIRTIVILASRSRMPAGTLHTELQPQLKPVQNALEEMRKLRLDRKFDCHTKAIVELCGALSWVLIKPPPQLPAVFCKEMVSSCEFWSNKIRKEYKGKDEKHVVFCDALKTVGKEIVAYITEYHKTGLAWNPHGVSLAEAIITLESEPEPQQNDPGSPRRRKQSFVTGGAGGMNTLMAELQKKQNSDGSSAATGLKRVSIQTSNNYVNQCVHHFINY